MAAAGALRQDLAERGIELLKELLEENTRLTRQVEDLTREIHGRVTA